MMADEDEPAPIEVNGVPERPVRPKRGYLSVTVRGEEGVVVININDWSWRRIFFITNERAGFRVRLQEACERRKRDGILPHEKEVEIWSDVRAKSYKDDRGRQKIAFHADDNIDLVRMGSKLLNEYVEPT